MSNTTPLFLTTGSSWLFLCSAVVTCLVGSYSALQLAAASLRLAHRVVPPLTALSFSVQSVFSLHFIAMCGMNVSLPWSFDIGLTLLSLLLIAVFGTAALSLTLWLRRRLEPTILLRFPDYDLSPSFRTYSQMAPFILSRVPRLRLLLAVVLMVVGAAGCHHLGLWSMQGADGALLTTAVTPWSLLFTGVIGGVVCVAAVLAFLLVPEGVPGLLTAALLTLGIGLFHFMSSKWGVSYSVGLEPTFKTGAVMGQESIIILVVVQGCVSQVISTVFSRIAIGQCRQAEQQLDVAERLGQHIACMDLDRAREMQLQASDPSPLEDILFHIVSNLQLYRPYLPDTLFMKSPEEEHQADSDAEGPSAKTGATTSRAHSLAPDSSPPSTRSRELPPGFENFLGMPASRSSLRLRTSRLSVCPDRQTQGSVYVSPTRPSSNFSLGLRASRVSVLRIRLAGLQYGAAKSLNSEGIEADLCDFMEAATHAIKTHGGTVLALAGGGAVAFWAGASPDGAAECAAALQRACRPPLTMVVQAGPFLVGNLASQHFRSFNLLGPLDWAGQLLLRAGGGGQGHIFATTREWESLRYKFDCLPYERVVVDGETTTLYSIAASAASATEDENEWMYKLAEKERAESLPMGRVTELWQAYSHGHYDAAAEVLPALAPLPPWYATHLGNLLSAAQRHGRRDPAKCLEAFGWPAGPPVGPILDS